jgi:thiol-disulfide isomerase/thioredoxin
MKPIVAWLCLWLVAIALTGCIPLPLITPPPDTTAELALDFHLTTLAGQPLALADLRGRWVLINFWATWCLPCRDEMPYLQQLADRHGDQLTVVGVNLREALTDVQPFVEELGLTFPILLQPDDATLLAYQVRGLPLSFVVSPRGELLFRQLGPLRPASFDAWLSEQMAAFAKVAK